MTAWFAEDYPLEGQKAFRATNVKRSKAFIQLLTDLEKGFTTMGVITGMQGKCKSIAAETAAAIERNDLKLLIVDEADCLNEDSFEMLRHLYNKTGCPILLVDLPSILERLAEQDNNKGKEAEQ